MQGRIDKVSPPTNDPRWRRVEAVMLRYGFQPHALIEVLHTVQKEFGYLDKPALRFVARALNMQPSKVYGVATFYHLFSLTPPAKHACVVCTGTACHIKGAGRILRAIEDNIGIEPGETTPDGAVSLEVARCLSFCGPAPVVEFDEESYGNLTPTAVVQQIRRWINHAS